MSDRYGDRNTFHFERYKNAFIEGFVGFSGSIYTPSGRNFQGNKTSWSAEVVSEYKEKVIEELQVEDTAQFLLNLEKQGKIKIYFFPNLPTGVPIDKSDIISRAVKWTIDFGEDTLDRLEKYHPDILVKVLKELIRN